jgi:hypothetical protein
MNIIFPSIGHDGNLYHFCQKDNCSLMIHDKNHLLDLGGWKFFFYHIELPDNFTLCNDLILSGSKTQKIPKNLTVHGDLLLFASHITDIPDCLTVHGKLFLNFIQSTSLGSNSTISEIEIVDERECQELIERFEKHHQYANVPIIDMVEYFEVSLNQRWINILKRHQE